MSRSGEPVDILDGLAAFDGKHTDALEILLARVEPVAGTIRTLLAAAGRDDARMQIAATWILKRFHDRGVRYTEAQSTRMLALLGPSSAWEARLHVLQAFESLVVPTSRVRSVHTVLRRGLDDDNKLVRAWTLHALAVLADRHRSYRRRVALVLHEAQTDEAASVRARVRRVLAAMPWAREPDA